MEKVEKKTYSEDDIKRIAPGYRGKPENFDPTKVGKKSTPKPPRRDPGNAAKRAPTLEPPAPTNLQTKESAQRNESIISESIFGVGVSVFEIAPRQSFAANYAKIVDVAAEVYDGYRADEKELERLLVREEVAYYATAMLHLKLLEVKAKQGEKVLRSTEQDLREATTDDVFNIPQPLFAYLSEIGAYCDKMGKETRLDVPDLPVAIAQGFGGYHANRIDEDSHNLFEEVPSLGIAGDMLMAVASSAAEPIPNFHVELPKNSAVTSNLVGKFYPVGPRRPEIAQRLAGYGITSTAFSEYAEGTRFNLRYIKSISDILGKFETYRIEKVCFKNT